MGLWDSITDLPGDIVTQFLSAISGLLVAFVQPLLELGKIFITKNIDPFHFQGLWIVIVGVISGFYFLLFLAVGLKFLVGRYDAENRKQAKEWAKKAILLVITVNASLLLYSLMLDVSSSTAATLWDDNFESLFNIDNLDALDLVWLSFFTITLLLAVITLAIRQIFLIAGVMLFPIGLFLNFIEPVKPYGSAILNVIGGAAFMNVLDVLILCAVQLFWSEFNTMQIMGIFAPTMGFLFIAVANTLLFIAAIWKGLNAAGVPINVNTIIKAVGITAFV